MNYLLDTHALLWNLVSAKKLSAQVKDIVLNPESNIFISAVSLWEISLKYRIGKLKLTGKNPEEIPGAVKSLGFNILDLNADTAATFYKFPISKNKDPFDLMLAWQAINGNLVLLSADTGFDDYQKQGLKRVW